MVAEAGIDCIIVNDLAAALQGSSKIPQLLRVCYLRSADNLLRMVNAMASVNARVRGTAGESFLHWDAETLEDHHDLNPMTDIGPLDLLVEVNGVGFYEDAIDGAEWAALFGYQFPVLEISKLIAAKRAAGRALDLVAVQELKALLGMNAKLDQH